MYIYLEVDNILCTNLKKKVISFSAVYFICRRVMHAVLLGRKALRGDRSSSGEVITMFIKTTFLKNKKFLMFFLLKTQESSLNIPLRNVNHQKTMQNHANQKHFYKLPLKKTGGRSKRRDCFKT